MSFNDYVKFVTEQLVKKMDEPRVKKELNTKSNDELVKQPLSNKAFGVIPLGISMFVHRKKNNS
ncbi:YqzE family protein [Alkalihalobacillus sp. 1P02AB]|uniref:YqzE family protein n=1 Tax=Alkalihalobacillus sp. 1P02AB TaxID=3132260 RepID=UPI0039A6F85D